MLTEEEVARYRRELGITPEQLGNQSRTGRTHGLLSTYRHGCRCEPCRAANRNKDRAARRKTSGRTHGRISTYNAGCRCEPCREVKSEIQARFWAKKRSAKDAPPPSHGVSGYNHGCRCKACVSAKSASVRRTRDRMRAALTPEQHGLRTSYDVGCRCEPCTAANTEYQRRYRELVARGEL